MIDLKFLGKGAAFYPPFGNTSAYFTLEEDIFFIDFGESVFEKVFKSIDLGKYRDIYVMITHLHADHCGSLGSLISYSYYVLDKKIHVIHPIDTVVQLLSLQGISQANYNYVSGLPLDMELSLQPIEVPHAKDMRAFGYVLSLGEDSLYYSGDASDLPKQVLDDYIKGHIKRIYQDMTLNESESHCNYKKLLEVIPEDKLANVYAMHLDDDYGDYLRDKGFSVVEVAK